MFVRRLTTPNPRVRLVMPVVTRDSALSVRWLSGSQGRETLRMMGVPDDHIAPASLDEEAVRDAGRTRGVVHGRRPVGAGERRCRSITRRRGGLHVRRGFHEPERQDPGY